MRNPDTWRGKDSQTTRNSRAVRSVNNGSMNGRVSQAKPVSPLSTHSQEPDEDGGLVWVGDDEPDYAPNGKLWFDTDEPVP